MIDIDIVITLQPKDWDGTLGGWRIDALRIPGRRVSRISIEGEELANDRFRVEGDALHLPAKPVRPVGVQLTIPGTLVEEKELSLKSAQAVAQAAHDKRQLRATVFLGILGTVAGIVTTYLTTSKGDGPSVPTQELRECRNGLERVLTLSNRPQSTIDTVRALISAEVEPCVRAIEAATKAGKP
jgi:hypothetical protein